MLRIRSGRLLSGASALAIVTALAATGTANADPAYTGPFTTPPITNDQPAAVTISGNATVDRNGGTNPSNILPNTNRDSFFNGLPMSGAANNVDIQNSYLTGDFENTGSMTSTANNALFIGANSQIGGRVFNSGDMTGQLNGIVLQTASTITEGVFNTGNIVGTTGDGLHVDSDSEIFGGILNAGLIQGGNDGIGFNDANIDFFGGINNSGSIIALGTTPGAGITWSGNSFNNGITNTKLIQGATNADGILITAGTFNGGIANQTGGTISGNGAANAAIRMTGGIFADSIVNDALITGTGGANGIEMAGVTMNGDITNNSSGSITVTGAGATDILLSSGSMTGTITNSGQMLAHAANSRGITMTGASTFTGDIINASGALISASGNAIRTNNTSFTGNISNSGSIESLTRDAIQEHSTTFMGDFDNTSSGKINGHFDALDLGGTTFQGKITNSGSMFATVGSGMDVSVVTLDGSITNSGSINAGADGINIRLGTTVNQGVTNTGSGHILAVNTGILVAGVVTGSVTNNGIIDPAVGIKVTGTVTGNIFNSDSILATTTGIDLVNETGITDVTQTAGLLRGNSVEDGSGTIADALDMTNAHANTFHANGGEVDGNIKANNSDVMLMDTNGTFVWLRGTGTGLGGFNAAGGEGDVILGGAFRGDAAGVGVIVGAQVMTVTGERVYLDDDTHINLVNGYSNTAGGQAEFYLTSDTTKHAVIAAGTTIDTAAANIAAFVDGTTFGAIGGNTFTYLGVMTGTTNGTTDNISTNSLFFDAQAIFNASSVDIELTRLSFADALVLPGMTQNESAIANALDNIYALGPVGPGGYGPDFTVLFNYLLSLGVGNEAAALFVFDELSGSTLAQTQQTTLDILNPFNTFMGQRLDDAMGSTNGGGFAHNSLRQQYAMLAGIMSDASPGLVRGDSGVSLWGRGYGQRLNVDGDAEAPGYDQDTGGAVGGVDVTVGRTGILGFALGWANTNVDFDTKGDGADVDSLQVGAYGSYLMGNFYLDGELAGAFHDLSTTRLLNLPPAAGGGMVAGADFSARSFSANAELGAVWHADNWLFQPNAGIMFTDVSTNSFVESGAGDFNLIVGDTDATSTASSVGLRVAALFNSNRTPLMPEISVAWRHEFDDDRQSFTAAFPDDPTSTFNIISSKISPDSALVGAGVSAGVSRNVEFFINYNGLINTDITVNNGSAGFRATW